MYPRQSRTACRHLGSIAPAAERRVDAINGNAGRSWGTLKNLLHVAVQQRHEPTGRATADRPSGVVSAAVSVVPDPAGQIRTALPAHPAVVTADPGLVRTAVEHLLNNALLFGGSGGPGEVSVSAEPQPTLTIRDHGPGMDST